MGMTPRPTGCALIGGRHGRRVERAPIEQPDPAGCRPAAEFDAEGLRHSGDRDLTRLEVLSHPERPRDLRRLARGRTATMSPGFTSRASWRSGRSGPVGAWMRCSVVGTITTRMPASATMPSTRRVDASVSTRHASARHGAQAMSVNVRSSTTGSNRPATAATAIGSAAHASHTRESVASRFRIIRPPAIVAIAAATASAGSNVITWPTAIARRDAVVGGIHDECPPRACTLKLGPHTTTHASRPSTIAARHHHASRSERRPGNASNPTARRNIETCVTSPMNTKTPSTGACHRFGLASHAQASTAIATPSSSSSAYMRASRPCTASKALTAMNAVAISPNRPLSRIHHANSATAASERTADGARNQNSLTPARARGACSR